MCYKITLNEHQRKRLENGRMSTVIIDNHKLEILSPHEELLFVDGKGNEIRPMRDIEKYYINEETGRLQCFDVWPLDIFSCGGSLFYVFVRITHAAAYPVLNEMGRIWKRVGNGLVWNDFDSNFLSAIENIPMDEVYESISNMTYTNCRASGLVVSVEWDKHIAI